MPPLVRIAGATGWAAVGPMGLQDSPEGQQGWRGGRLGASRKRRSHEIQTRGGIPTTGRSPGLIPPHHGEGRREPAPRERRLSGFGDLPPPIALIPQFTADTVPRAGSPTREDLTQNDECLTPHMRPGTPRFQGLIGTAALWGVWRVMPAAYEWRWSAGTFHPVPRCARSARKRWKRHTCSRRGGRRMQVRRKIQIGASILSFQVILKPCAGTFRSFS